MSRIDLWGEEATEESTSTIIDNQVNINDDVDMEVTIQHENILLYSKKNLEDDPCYSSLYGVYHSYSNHVYSYSMAFTRNNAFVLRYMLHKYSINIPVHTAKALAGKANTVTKPYAKLSEKEGFIDVFVPNIPYYLGIIKILNGWRVKDCHRVRIEKALDIGLINKKNETMLPRIKMDKRLIVLNSEPLPGFDGTIESLARIPINSLNLVQQSAQSYHNIKKSAKTIEDKMKLLGISTLQDLLLWFPRRYIDKTQPQKIGDLMIGESTTLFGTIKTIATFGKPGSRLNAKIILQLDEKSEIEVIFWRQEWLAKKYRAGDKIVITGTVGYYHKSFNVSGKSIDEIKEASLMPIVPIYNQSTSKGITTAFILSCVREMFARLGDIKLEDYFKQYADEKQSYVKAYKELHMPSSMKNMEKALEFLSYYELVYLQLLIQKSRNDSINNPGVSMTSTRLTDKMIELLPFTLTGSQEKAVATMKTKLAASSPSETLLNAEVGSGKTIIAQLACLQAASNNYQSVLIGPTEVLAHQLYSTFRRLVDVLNNNGENINLIYYHGGMKAKERRESLESIKNGEAHIIVGTHSLLSDSVEYNNLGFVAIDEQQKFGTEQRDKLKNVRPDEKKPDLLTQTATPIPRSTAQVFYGDIDMLTLMERPPGRKPIITTWIEENVNDFLNQTVNEVWVNLREAAKRGEQGFIITPLVLESEKIDAASVENTYKLLSKNLGLRVAYVHGKMKREEQTRVMEEFRDHKYDILVSSTVVEVGVDIPNATQVVVLSAERLGASSLHQIRGRVGRNNKQSYCYLVSPGTTMNSRTRLQALVDSDNGFDIAKTDLMVRGEGKLFGVEQSGSNDMIHGNLIRYSYLIPEARKEALDILESVYSFEAIEDAKVKFNIEDIE